MTEHSTIRTIGVTVITIIVTYLIQLHKLSANVNLTMVLLKCKRWVNVSCESLTHYHSVPSCTMKGGNTHIITQFAVSTSYILTRT